MEVYTYKKELVLLADEPFSSGGEGEVRYVTSCPERFNNVCAKLYFKPKQTKEHECKIRYMVENPPQTIVGNGMMLAWPLETIYTKNGVFIGFLMPTAFPDSKKLVILTLPKIKKAHKIEWYKFDKEYNIRFALVSRMKLINNIAIPIHLLHATEKYVLKDFKPDNVLVTPSGKVTVVDMDSIQICENGKILFPGTAATEEYVPPEFYKGVGRNNTVPLLKSWDNFAISVVFYKLLFGLNPYAITPKAETDDSSTVSYCIKENLFPYGKNSDKIKTIPAPHNNFKIIPQPIQHLFVRSFGDNPADRPQAKEWIQTIKDVIKNVGPINDTPQLPKPLPIEHNIRLMQTSNGKLKLSTYQAKEGTIITVNDYPDSGYKLDEISYSYSGKTVSLKENQTFVMPDSDVTVSANFVKQNSGLGCQTAISIISLLIALMFFASMLFDF